MINIDKTSWPRGQEKTSQPSQGIRYRCTAAIYFRQRLRHGLALNSVTVQIKYKRRQIFRDVPPSLRLATVDKYFGDGGIKFGYLAGKSLFQEGENF